MEQIEWNWFSIWERSPFVRTGFTKGLFFVLKSEGSRICRVSGLTPASAWSSRASRDLGLGNRGDLTTHPSAGRLLLKLICRRVFELTLPSVQTVNRAVVWMSCQSLVSLLPFCDVIIEEIKYAQPEFSLWIPTGWGGHRWKKMVWAMKNAFLWFQRKCEHLCYSGPISQDFDWERAGAGGRTPICFRRTAIFRFGI